MRVDWGSVATFQETYQKMSFRGFKEAKLQHWPQTPQQNNSAACRENQRIKHGDRALQTKHSLKLSLFQEEIFQFVFGLWDLCLPWRANHSSPAGGTHEFSGHPEGFSFFRRLVSPPSLTDACCSQSGRELREPEGSCSPGPMRAPAEWTLPFMDNTRSPANTNKTGALWLDMPHSPSTAGAEKHPQNFTDRHTRDSPAQVRPRAAHSDTYCVV